MKTSTVSLNKSANICERNRDLFGDNSVVSDRPTKWLHSKALAAVALMVRAYRSLYNTAAIGALNVFGMGQEATPASSDHKRLDEGDVTPYPVDIFQIEIKEAATWEWFDRDQ
ncbi:hypothetical protein WGT02_08275 [Rhizobium sp. T1470]|uniref:hypothetical protein n=1 Tax=unclassified Rhizobium TaxID=2613769 RepID=UPI001AAEF92D|nr:hypothetical protein [Rhizobium sp. T1473]MCA0801277.1 hypothetical protein [Rhizobium sp. T1473]